MTENRFFTWIWRFNGLAIAIAATLIIAILGWELSRDWRRQAFPTQTSDVLNIETPAATDTATPAPAVTQTLRFGPPIDTPKRGIYALPQYAEQEYENRGISKSSNGNRVNFLIINTQDQSQAWLFPAASRLILEVRDIWYMPNDGPRTLMGRVIEVVDTDTNGDGRLSGTDFSSLYYVNPEWAEPILLVADVDYVLSTQPANAAAFDVIYVGEDTTKLVQFTYPQAAPTFEIILGTAP